MYDYDYVWSTAFIRKRELDTELDLFKCQFEKESKIEKLEI